ncbi:MAG: DUF481 domain-containing protein [Thiothrix sp.]|nr:DUF481 domain-containing protein [Thiothrix sp.]HPQ96694.1 DUF481 domain-containing protein [Thiolinea sp.]
MKKRMISFAVATVLASAAQAEVTLYDYKEGTSAYEEAYVNGGLTVNRNRGDDQTAYDLNLGVNYDRTLSSPSRDLNLQADIDGNVSRAGTKDADDVDSYTAGASITVDNYFVPGSNTGFWFGGASVRANDAFDDLETTASIGVGYGRVTNVTPMAKAMRVIDELVKYGVIKGRPPVSVYQQIASVISKEPEYYARFGSDYELKWIGDVEAVLRSAGIVNSLGAIGILRTQHVLVDENISLRRYGWKVRAGLSYVGSNFDGLTDKPGVLLGAEYHHPLNNQTQLSDVATVNFVLNDGDNGYNFNNNLSLTYEVDDRIDWENTWNLNYAKNSVNNDDVTTNNLTSTFAYEINNTLDFTTTARIQHINGSSDAANPDGTDRALIMGVRYRLR